MSKIKKLAILLAIMISALIALVFVVSSPTDKVSEPVEKKPKKVTVTIKAVGDNLLHMPVINSCETATGYNFDGLYAKIEPYIEDADIAAINQETIFVDEASAYSGYPSFGTPSQVGDSVVKSGFNTITHATNHTYDRGEKAVVYTMDFWNKYDDVTVLGIQDSAEKQDEIEIWEKDGVKIAMFNFTYGLNGNTPAADKSYLVNVFNRGEKYAELLRRAEECADLTVVFIHFGTEYTHKPTKEQVKDVEFLTENGCDIVIGAHPHVIQPVTEHISENGNKSIVFYSLGNFLSNQSGTDKVLGGMASVTISKENDEITVDSYEMIPTVTHASDGKYTVYALSDYKDELAAKHSRCSGLTTQKLWDLYNNVMAIDVNK